MGRGKNSENGAERKSPNGYWYVKVDGKWRLKHHLVAEKMLGRPLLEDESVRFVTGNKDKLTYDNIKVVKKGKASLRRRLSVVEARIEEYEAERDQLKKDIDAQS